MRKIYLAPTINLNAVTLQDCLDMYTYRGKAVVLNDGKVKGFVKEDVSNESNPRNV